VAQPIGNAERVQLPLHLGEVVAALGAQVIGNARERLDDGLIGRHLAVQNAQRVGLGSPLAIAAQARDVLAQGLPQGLDVPRTALRVSHGVEDQLVGRDAAAFEIGQRRLDHLHVDRGPRHAEGLDVQLMELPVTSLLRLLPAEHRSDGVDLERRIGLEQVVLDDRANDPRRGLGAQGQG
jgi:hypothetical protein